MVQDGSLLWGRQKDIATFLLSSLPEKQWWESLSYVLLWDEVTLTHLHIYISMLALGHAHNIRLTINYLITSLVAKKDHVLPNLSAV